MFIDNFLKLCSEKGVSSNKACIEIGVARTAVAKWKNGSIPSGENLQKIADYFNVSVDYLLGKEDNKKSHVIDMDSIPGIIKFDNFKQIPIIGTIACGSPILAEENHDGYTQIEINVHADFALKCKGDSMNPKFLDGDIVLIRQQPMVENGQIAAVLIDNESTLKRVYMDGERIILTPENLSFPPIIYTGEEMNNIKILGLAVGYTRIF